MKTETYEYTSTVVKTAVLNAMRVEKNLWVFSKTESSKRAKSTGTFKAPLSRSPAVNRQGFLDDHNYSLLKSGKQYKTLDLSVMPLDVQEKLRTQGWHHLIDIKFDTDKPYDKFVSNPIPNTVVRLDVSSHMVFDRKGQPLPVGILFDYIGGRISNGTYNLEKLAKHLLKRSDVVVFTADGWRGEVDFDKQASTVAEAIVDVPYYNREANCSRTIYFMWQPNKTAYRRMWTECLKLHKEYPSTRMREVVFNLDLLGVRAAGAALCTSFYETVPSPEKDYEYDE